MHSVYNTLEWLKMSNWHDIKANQECIIIEESKYENLMHDLVTS